MPLARMMLSISQRWASNRCTCGGPRWSRIGGNPWVGRVIGFLLFGAGIVVRAPALPDHYRRIAWRLVNDRDPEWTPNGEGWCGGLASCNSAADRVT